MKKVSYCLLILAILFPAVFFAQAGPTFQSRFTAAQLTNAPARLIPFPQLFEWEEATVTVTGWHISEGGELSEVLRRELQSIAAFYGLSSHSQNGLPLHFRRDAQIEPEGYRLAVTLAGIELVAATETGFFYGLQTLRQLLQTNKGQVTLPVCHIEDAPAFPVRGYMIDVGRNFQSMSTLKKQLDIMARYKLNTFHWHLTDRPAWRIESKKYPELTAAEHHRPGRSPGQFYTYEEIRALIQYARERHIQVIPEIDMPGHSDSFVRAMGVRMESEEGVAILKNVLAEFFQEIPVEDCPIIHIGSDEVRIDHPEEFIAQMVAFCESNDRQVMIWNPGLPAHEGVIRQTWQGKDIVPAAYPTVDSWNSYINNGEPMTQIQRLFFKPIGYRSPNEVLGGILCLWPDVRLESGEDAFRQNPVYPSLLTYAWATWTADITEAPAEYYMTLPAQGSEAFAYFAAFEKILLHHKATFFSGEPFAYFAQQESYWRLIGPFQGNDGDTLVAAIQPTYTYQGQELSWKEAVGNTLVIKDRFRLGGYFPEAQTGETVYALTWLYSDQERDVPTLIGFETPMRANRTYTGIPGQGSWDVSGGNIWVNEKALTSPVWKDAGWRPDVSEGWSTAHQEKPWGAEELYWTREPSRVALRKGWNKILVKVPGSSDYQNWMFTFIPLEMQGLAFATEPTRHSTYYQQRKTHFEELPKDTAAIVFIGDSLTDGGEWSELLDNPKVKNRGISGDVSQGVWERLDAVTAAKPQKVFVMIGINDLARGIPVGQVVRNVRMMVAQLQRECPGTHIYLQSLLPVNDDYGQFKAHTNKGELIREVNAAFRQMAGEQVTFIDLHTAFSDVAGKLDRRYTNDGLHLNGTGYQRWAAIVAPYVD